MSKQKFGTSKDNAKTATPAPAAAKVEVPKGPVEVATKNDTLKCLTATHNGMTYFGVEVRTKDGKETQWRNCYNVKRIFDKADAINTTEGIDAETKAKKIAEALKSMTNPCPKLPFSTKTESGFDGAKSEAPAA